MEIIDLPIDKVIPYARNPRKGGAVQKVAGSLKEFGFKQPIVVDGEMVVIAGHTRLEAARQLGLDKVPVLIARDLDPVKVKAYRIADNRVADDASWDVELLGLELADLKEFEFDMPLLGFEDDELQAYAAGAGTGARDDEDDVPEPPEEPVTRPGDLWVLGNHRLLCGDATVATDVERVLGGAKPDMAWCDPPYGIDIVNGSTVGGAKPFGAKAKRGTVGASNIVRANIYNAIIGDDSVNTAVSAVMLCACLKIPVQIWWGANYYADRLPPSSCWIAWDKERTGNFADGELAWTNLDRPTRVFRHEWNGMLKASERGERRVHPAQKPIVLAMWCFTEFGKAGDIVLDLFLGSAPSLIAAERLGRKLLGMELSPNYIDVAVQRWQNETGKEAVLDGTGQTFAAVAAAREVREYAEPA